MFLLGFVNSKFEATRLAGHLELVHLSLEKAHQEKQKQEEGGVLEKQEEHHDGSIMTVSFATKKVEQETKGSSISNGVARSRRPSVEDLSPDLYMQPLLWPLVLKSPKKTMPVHVREQDDVDQEWSFWNLECHDASRRTATLASAFAETKISTGVQHHPLEITEERDTNACEGDTKICVRDESSGHSDEGFERILQHLQRIEGSVKDLKARVDDAKLRIEQSEHEWGRDCDPAVALPSLSPSLSSPMMEKMAGSVASPELPYSWNKKLNPRTKSESFDRGAEARDHDDGEAPVMQEERELRYSPPLADSDAQDVLSFRLWEQEAPKSKRRSRKEGLDLETALDLVADEYAMSKDLKLPFPDSGFRCYDLYDDHTDAATKTSAADQKTSAADQKTSAGMFDQKTSTDSVDLRSRRAHPKVKVDPHPREEFNNPSPCSFTCGLSPTSLFSDDQEPFQMSVSIDESMYFKMFSGGKASPRSVLSPKDDEFSRSDHSCAYLYDGESSDLESPTKVATSAAPPPPFPTFTYNLGRDEIGETSSSDESETSLEFFQEAADSSPWLGNGVLDDSDLEFLLSPDMKTSIVALEKKKSSPKPKSWVPYVKGEAHAPPARDVFVASLPREKTAPKKRSVNFAADLVKEIPPSPEPSFEKKPAAASVNIPQTRHAEEGPSIMTSRRWRKESSPSPSRSAGSRRQKVVDVMACSGKLFSWPQKLSYKVSKGKVSRDEETSFGTSARRDAEQVRRILKGSQKRYSNLTVDEMMKEDFSK